MNAKVVRPLFGFWMLAGASVGQSADRIDYTKDVKPIFARHCVSCHGATRQEGGLRLDASPLIRKGGEGGPTLTPGQSEASLLVDAVLGRKGMTRMPVDAPALTDAEVGVLRRWIAEGALAPDEPIPPDPRKHWAFQPPVKKAPPNNTDPAGAVDGFLQAQRRANGLTARPGADRDTLLRRVTIDLVGLPPTRSELLAFRADRSADAYEKVVDRLLASPQYGERWGRHWMDIWRYADWAGYGDEIRVSQRHIWRWRDWIVQALNADKPYDRMIQEMLAGDELAPTDPNVVVATGYLARNWYRYNRNVWLDDIIEHTSKAFLGVTMNCAKCHNHMYDPVTQSEYYQFRAFFEPHQVRTDRLPAQPDILKDGIPRVFDEQIDAKAPFFVRGDERQPKKDVGLLPAIPTAFALDKLTIEPKAIPREARAPALQPTALQEALEQARAEVDRWSREHSKLAQESVSTPTPQALAPPPTPIFDDHFQDPKTRWTFSAGDWKLEPGKVRQSKVGPQACVATSNVNHPRDFMARLEFTTVGGQMWKSVGLSFDNDGETYVSAYASAYQAEPSLAVSRTIKGETSYPADGRARSPVELNKRHALEIAVQNNILQMSLDGVRRVVHILPGERRPGRLAFWAFDAVVDFHRVTLTPMESDVVLAKSVAEPNLRTDPASRAKRTQGQLRLAEKGLSAAHAGQQAVVARMNADLAKVAEPPTTAEKLAELSSRAGLAERESRRLQAEFELAQAEFDRDALGAGKTPDAGLTKRLTDAEKKLADAKAELGKPVAGYTSLGPIYPAKTSGRRTALASWMTDRRNPLTARVAVNHIWARHFGAPLVASAFDFGNRGEKPTHPELLDWLAVEFMDQGWSMKKLHRRLVLTSGYRMDSRIGPADAENVRRDPDNRMLWRQNTRRMEAEVIRDSVLYVGGQLDLTLGGRDIPHADGLKTFRRSLYYQSALEKQMTLMRVFNGPNLIECYQRSTSVIPQQSLALANNPLVLQQSRRLAIQIAKSIPLTSEFDATFASVAYETILGRSPNPEELATMTQFLATKASIKPVALQAKEAPLTPRENLIHVLFNHNEFVTVR